MRSYVCVLSTNNYLNGVLILNENLKRLNSNYGLLCLVNETISNETLDILSYFGINYKVMLKIKYDFCNESDSRFLFTFDKLNIFSLVEYEKIVFLDADLLILENIDYLFDYPSVSITKDLPWYNDKFNSGVMVLEPNIEWYNGLISLMLEYNERQMCVGDQDVITNYFTGINSLPDNFSRVVRIREWIFDKYFPIFNETKQVHSVLNYIQEYSKTSIIHYVGIIKPFDIGDKWFDDESVFLYKYYNSIVIDKLNNFKLFNSKKISVIVPIYNNEKELNDNIYNLLGQTYSNLEIIFIDDNSIDKSFNICKKLALDDSRIIVKRNKNSKGVLSCRNLGIDNASGDYIYFYNPKFWIKNDFLEKMFISMENNDLDVLQCASHDGVQRSIYDFGHDGELIEGFYNNIVLDKNFIYESFIDHLFTFYVNDKMFKTDVLKKFNKGNLKLFNENIYKFFINLIPNINKIGSISDVLVEYQTDDFIQYQNMNDFDKLKICDYFCSKVNECAPSLSDKIINYKAEWINEILKNVVKLDDDLLKDNHLTDIINYVEKFLNNSNLNIINEYLFKDINNYINSLKCRLNIKNNNINDKILVILPYFTKHFPNYFNLYLNSVKYNDTIDFLLITDCHDNYKYPKNMKVIYKDFSEVQNLIKKSFPFDVKIDTPYKLCDYKPFYSLIFSEYTNGYDYIGYGDIDVIYGDLRKFLNFIEYKKYLKIFDLGHFSLIRNDEKLYNFLINLEDNEIFSSKYVYSFGDIGYFFDEFYGMIPIFDKYNLSIYNYRGFFSDIYREMFYFRDANNEEFKYNNQIFSYVDGNLYGQLDTGLKREFIYIHLQRRKMINNVKTLNKFYIIPNEFVDYDNLNVSQEFYKEATVEVNNEEYSKALSDEKSSKKMFNGW